MEDQPEVAVYSKKGRKRPASSVEQREPKRFQDDAVLEDGVEAAEQDGGIHGVAVHQGIVHEAVQVESGGLETTEREDVVVATDHELMVPEDPAAPGALVRQDTFTKDDGGASGGRAEQFYIPVEQKEISGRREALFKRLSARRKESNMASATRWAAQTAASKTTSSESRKTRTTRRRAAPPQPETQPPALQRQGTFTIEDHDDNPRRQKEQATDLMDPGEDIEDDATANLKTVAEMRVALAALRRGRAAAERAERAARERASRDALRTRAALQDLHARLAATREALHAEKDGLHRKLSADFRRALADREAVWRQERERTTAQVRALETELRTARAQLGSMQADALRKATTTEADLRRTLHDQEAAFRAQIAEVATQRDSLQAQLRDKDKLLGQDRAASPAGGVRPGHRPGPRPAARDEALQRSACALRRELQDARKRHALLEAQLKEAQLQAGRRPAATQLESELARALHAKEQEYRRDAAEAAKKHDALEAQLRDALRALRDACGNKAQEKAASRPGKQTTLALESHRQEEEEYREEAVPGPRVVADADGPPPEQVQARRRHKRRRQDSEPETEEDDETQSNEHNDERRRRLLQELERLRERNAALQEAWRVAAWRRRGRRRGRRRRVGPAKHPPTDTNAGKRETEEGLMRHFHRLISLEPVSEAEEFPVTGGGLVGLGGPLGGSLGGPQSPLSSGPSSLSPTPGIGDVWNDLAAGCATSSGGSPCSQGGSSGSSSPGGESLGEGGSSSPEQLGAHSVLYWQLMRDHLQLQRAYQQMQQLQASSKNNDRQARAKLEAQVYDLKRALSRRPCLPALPAQTHGAALADALQDVVELRQREQALTAELTELRDQNELLEFRLLELEGIVDKSSVCSATRDVCTDTESDTVTEDSGLLSLGASDDGDNHAGPALQHGDSAAVREKLALLASSLEAEEDRGCLQRALQLLDSYQQQLIKDAAAKPQSQVKAPNQRIVATVLPFTDVADDAEDLPDAKQSSRDEFRRKQEFFNQIQRLGGSSASPTNTTGNNHNKTLKHADCLQESGIFEEEDGVLADLASAATQTEGAWACSCHQSASQSAARPAAAETDAPFSSLPVFGSTAKKAPPAAPTATGALSAEIQKLSQIRERFEEHGAVTKLKRPEAPTVPPSTLGATQMQLKMRELDFFRSRAALLEDKLAELERCSDPELRGCARLLERVAALERQAREAREAADLLVRRNRDLEEERCELEEAENDTRLRCQQLEVEVVQLREREGALEVELGRARRSLSAAHQLQGRLEMALQSLETRNFELEEAECELRASIAAVESALPAIVAFHLAHYKHYLEQRELRGALPLPAPTHSMAVCTGDADEEYVDEVDGAAPPTKRDDSEVLERLAQLVAAEQDMHQKIAFLEQKESAFQETLAAADGLWTEMELNYKRRLARAEEAEEELRGKVRRLEDSESKLRQALADQAALSERVHELEAQERVLLARIRSLEQEKQALAEEADRFHEEMRTCRGALQALQERIHGPMAEEAAAERRRALDLAEELRSRQEALAALEQRTNTEISALQSQIAVGEKTMQDMEVTCAELREEVDTLEEAVGSLRAQLSAAHDKAERDLFHVESALAAKDQQLEELRREKEAPPPALNDEMAAAAQAAQAAAQQPEEDDDADEAKPTPSSVSLFRKSLQAFRNSEMMMMMTASKPATPPKPVPKKETDGSKAFASLPPMPTAPAAKRTPPPLPPKNVLALKWARSDTSAASGR